MSVASDTALRSALDEAAASFGLHVDAVIAAAALTGLAGPFVTRDLPGSGGATSACVAVRDVAGGGSDELALALAQALGDGSGGREAEPVASGADLVTRFAGPFEAVGLSDGAEVQAVVLTAVERRSGRSGDGGPDQAALGESMQRAMAGFDKLVNVALDVSVELGRTRVTLSEVLEFDVGSVVELDRAAGAPVDIRVNGTLLAQGEVVLIDDEYAVRITAIVEPGSLG